MLVLSRKPKESIMIGDNIEIHIIDIKKDQVKIGLLAPKDVIVHRKEIYDEIRMQNVKASKNAYNEKIVKTLSKILKIPSKKSKPSSIDID